MDHPENLPPPGQRKSPLSDLMQQKAKALTGQKVNVCPFGCVMKELDEHGYCRHLVGFCELIPGVPQERLLMEPMIMDNKGRRIVQCRQVKNPAAPDGDTIPELDPVLPTDSLVRISTCARVYRRIEESPKALSQTSAVA